MLEARIISISDSEFASPIIMVHKKDFTWHLCFDYRNLNMLTIKYSLRSILLDAKMDLSTIKICLI
jgi:hypothetical protein